MWIISVQGNCFRVIVKKAVVSYLFSRLETIEKNINDVRVTTVPLQQETGYKILRFTIIKVRLSTITHAK